MAASPKDKFEAAVNVIQSLPKNGSFQPSHELMLRFYGYFKQATIGPCSVGKPAFWDMVGRYKWDAWHQLGDMPKEEAMNLYVEELKKVLKEKYPAGGVDNKEIVEAMPHTEMVQNFVKKLDNFYELVDDDGTQRKAKVKDSVGNSLVMSSPGKVNNGPSFGTLNGAPVNRTGDVGDDDEYTALATPSSVESEPVLVDSPSTSSSESDDKLNGTTSWEHVAATDDHSREEGEDDEGEEFCDTIDIPQEGTIDSASSSPNSQRDAYSYSHPQAISEPALRLAAYQQSQASAIITRDQSTANFMGGASMITDVPWKDDTLPHGYVDYRGGGTSVVGGGQQGGSGTGTGAGAASQTGSGPSYVTPNPSYPSLYPYYQFGGSGGGSGGSPGGVPLGYTDVSSQIAVTLTQLQQDMHSVLVRLETLEALTLSQQRNQNPGHTDRGWWPFNDIQGRTVIFLTVWPFIVQFLLRVIRRRQNRQT